MSTAYFFTKNQGQLADGFGADASFLHNYAVVGGRSDNRVLTERAQDRARMDTTRRQLLAVGAIGAAAYIFPVSATPRLSLGINAAQFGVHPDATGDQSKVLQTAIDQTAEARAPLWLAPGVYRAGNLSLPSGAHLVGTSGATRIVLAQGPSLLFAEHADGVTLAGLILDGGGLRLPKKSGLVHIQAGTALHIADCQLIGSGGNAIALEKCDGEVTQSTIIGAADNALFCNDSNGMRIVGNKISKSGNGGIRVWQSSKRRDGTLIADNWIDDTGARDGGTGENGNAINVFRAANVTVRGNHIKNAAFSAIRGNAASHIQIIDNHCSGLDEVAIYSEFDFEDALIADNVIDGAASGISVTNFKEGGHLAVVRGNSIRNLRERRLGANPAEQGFGIGVEADTTVTGNVIEHAETIGINVGWGPYLRDVTVANNIVRDAGIGIAVSVVDGAGDAVISDNQIMGALHGAIVGMKWQKAATGDLVLAGAEHYPKLRIRDNHVS